MWRSSDVEVMDRAQLSDCNLTVHFRIVRTPAEEPAVVEVATKVADLAVSPEPVATAVKADPPAATLASVHFPPPSMLFNDPQRETTRGEL